MANELENPDLIEELIASFDHSGRGSNIEAAYTVLGDGRARACAEIVADAVAAKLLPEGTDSRVVYVSLINYIDRVRAAGRVPRFVQDPDRRFRINQSTDGWPDVPDLPVRPAHPEAAAVSKRLLDSSAGPDGTAFELAVCDAFAALGFNARHVGGKGAPDAVLDAPLGTLGYRVMVECKTTSGNAVPNPHVAEAAKYREQYRADYATLVGPAFPVNDAEFVSEVQMHRVSVWTVTELTQLLEIGADPIEVRGLFELGFAADGMESIRWNRSHGRAKRVKYIAATLCSEGWNAQCGTAEVPSSAPHLTEDAAMLLVDTALRAANSVAVCDRSDVKEAFHYLTSPLVGGAEWLDADQSGIVIRRARL